ncbi:hypothetical protein K438DRAFT_332684 [Mycena galopus ATCC 62051]|nr:hypothetical protein K438DRAFT_332684 [Mycena galopus ATCC 62051]
MSAETSVCLPPELERVIFELAASKYPETITTLILVAKRVCIWIEPQLYRVGIFDTLETIERLQRMLQSKPPEFLRRHVHHMVLTGHVPQGDMARVLSTCTNVHDLGLWMGSSKTELLDEMRHLTNIQRLSVNLFDLLGGGHNFHLPPLEELPFARVTHLDAFGLIPEKLYPLFGRLPCLTHLAVDDYSSISEMMEMVLPSCAVLQLLVVTWRRTDPDTEDSAFSTVGISDPRFCTVPAGYNMKRDWEEGTRGGLDFWRRAEMARDARNERRRNGSVSDESQSVRASNSPFE